MMKIRIYQINKDRDRDSLVFADLETAQRLHGEDVPKAETYDKVFDGEVDCNDLEDVFEKFNIDHPAGYRGRSLSISDVVEVVEGDKTKPGFYFCDTYGYKKVDFDTGKVPVEQKMQVVMLRPKRKAEITEIETTFEAMQGVVGGDIQAIYPYDEEVCIVCNEESKIMGLPLNRGLYTEPEEVDISYRELFDRLSEKESDGTGDHINGYIVFSEDSFDKPYPLEARTYEISSNNKAFQAGRGGYSIYGSSLDGTDICVRLDVYLCGTDAWKIERCYMLEDNHEMYDILAGNAFICSCAGENFGSLTDEQAKRYAKKFENPEIFMKVNGQIKIFPMRDDKENEVR